MAEAAPYPETGELAKRHGVTPRALRFYEQQGLLRPERSGTGSGVRRLYSPLEQCRLRLILRGTKMGLTLALIRDGLKDEAGQAVLVIPRAALEGRRAAIEAEIGGLSDQLRDLIAFMESATGDVVQLREDPQP